MIYWTYRYNNESGAIGEIKKESKNIKKDTFFKHVKC